MVVVRKMFLLRSRLPNLATVVGGKNAFTLPSRSAAQLPCSSLRRRAECARLLLSSLSVGSGTWEAIEL